jgi:hypothetical protein
MESKIIDRMKIYRGGNSGSKPMVEVIYMTNGIRQNPVNLPWDEPDVRTEKIFPYLNGYTLIEDTRI